MVLLAPLAEVINGISVTEAGSMRAFWQQALPRYTLSTLMLASGVLVLALTLGGAQAWILDRYDFPGRNWLVWAVLLPFTMPSYLLAYVYADLLQGTGPLQTWLRSISGWSYGSYWFPEARSLPFAILLMSVALSPYAYLAASAALRAQSSCILDAARTLGYSPWAAFWRIGLPMLRPALAAGGALITMEVLNDFGTVDHLAIDTLATGITRSWYAYGQKPLALKIAATVLLLSVLLIASERRLRARARYTQPGGTLHLRSRRVLKGPGRLVVWIFLGGCVIFAFALPLIRLLGLASAAHVVWPDLAAMTIRSTALAAATAATVTAIGFVIAWGFRRSQGPWSWPRQWAAMGYGVPGAVIAVGIMQLWPAAIGSSLLLLYGLVARFAAIGINALDASLTKISPSMDDAARTLGASTRIIIRRIYLPLLGPGVRTVLVLVFVDTIKELSATMILSPLNFSVLSTYIHNLAADERLADCAPAALVMVAIGTLPLLVFQRLERSR